MGGYSQDTADLYHRLLDVTPEHNRTAMAALLDLPPEYPIGDLTPAKLAHLMKSGHITGDQVMQALNWHGVLRPGQFTGGA